MSAAGPRILTALVVTAALGASGWVVARQFESAEQLDLPVAQVRHGEFVAIVRCRGEVKAGRAVQIYAPLVPNLRISWMAPAGERVEQGAPIIRFDSSNAQQDLIQKQAGLRQAEATLQQAVSQAKITAQHDEADLANAKLDVELAELKTATNEFVSRIEAEQSQIDLEVARQKLRVLEAEVEQHAVSGEAKIASLTRQRDKAQAEIDLTTERLSKMEILAPLTGFAIFGTNYSQSPTNPQPFKVGDSVFGGMNLAVIPDMTSLLIDVTIEETDRGRVSVGNDVLVRVDALPELVIEATLTQISPLAELALEFPLRRSFRGYASLPDPDPRLRPGMNGGMDIVIERIPDAISIPAQALFTQAGKPAVYVMEEGQPRLAEVEVLARNPEEVAISGIPDDAVVALVEPQSEGGESSGAAGGPGVAGGQG